MTRKRVVIGSIITGCMTLAVSAVIIHAFTPPNTSVLRSLIDNTFLRSLSQKQTNLINTSHLAPGITPPTNKWFSGLALQPKAYQTFPLPLSFMPTENTFEISLPKVKATASTLFGIHTAAIQISITDAVSYQITRYDELSVDLTYKDKKGESIGIVTVTAGSPYVFYEASRPSKLSIPGSSAHVSDSIAQLVADGTTYNIVGSTGASLIKSDAFINATLPAGGLVSFYALPSGQQTDPLKASSLNKVTGVSVAYKQQGDQIETSLTYKTKNQKPTAYGYLPHQAHTAHDSGLKYDTLYGQVQVVTGTAFQFTTPVVPVTDSLDVSRISGSDRNTLVTALRQDINATQFDATDTYFGGKNVYRAAQLLKLAKSLGEESLATSIQEKLNRELSTWLSGGDGNSDKSFYYDSSVHGIVGKTPSFGSEAFNDHHFHYGYFIYAASILAQYDHNFLTDNRAAVDLLVADIANYETGESIPLRRSFDPYTGHSWASGTAPFGDGNNQESSSEATNAWIGTQLWANVTNNTALKQEAVWMLSNETVSTQAYWMNFDRSSAPYNQGYNKSIISLNWGGKRDYATFFSGEPNAQLGIQLIPMSPTMTYLSAEGPRITNNVAGTTLDSSAQFADYILMYRQLYDGTVTLAQAQALSDANIDSANSRAYLYAWILSHKK